MVFSPSKPQKSGKFVILFSVKPPEISSVAKCKKNKNLIVIGNIGIYAMMVQWQNYELYLHLKFMFQTSPMPKILLPAEKPGNAG